MIKKKIFFFTANRAEYNLISPFIKLMSKSKKLNIGLIVAGSHHDASFGKSINEIKRHQLKFFVKIKTLIKTNENSGALTYCSFLQKKLNKIFNRYKPDLVFASSDRFETFAFVFSAYIKKIPIIHYEGGDVTDGGALDDNLRHAITKLSNLHLTTNINSLKRIIKMGEEKFRCLNVGYSPFSEIKKNKFNLDQIKNKFNLDAKKPLILFTMHPLISNKIKFKKEITETFIALEELYKKNYKIIITYPNFDPGYKKIIKRIKKLKKKCSNLVVIKHLGQKNYHSLLYYIGKTKNGVCLGNSSSGIKETVFFNCPTVNIGDRQSSRLKTANVIDVKANKFQIISSVKNNLYVKIKNIKNPYKLTINFNNLLNVILKKCFLENFKIKKCTY